MTNRIVFLEFPRIPKDPSSPADPFLYMTTPELLAIRGQSSAASLPTGPVMAEPFISPLGLTICAQICQLGVPVSHICHVSEVLTTPALSSK